MQRDLNLSKLKTYSLKERPSKVTDSDFAKAPKKGSTFSSFIRSLPKILASRDIVELADSIVSARQRSRPVIFMMGAHIIKCGLGPVIIDLIKRNIITAVAMNGAGIIHDFEIAYGFKTSEDVASAIKDGSFGMSKETADFLNTTIAKNYKEGIGRSVGAMIAKKNLPNKKHSILYACFKKNIPATVHVAMGTDIIHIHPSCDGAAVGEASLIDFRKFAKVVAGLKEGGVALNAGSAVILPEVFLKALSIARNLGYKVSNITTCDFDMIRHYRPTQNVLIRPTSLGGRHYAITGHHEIMLPLLAQMIVERL